MLRINIFEAKKNLSRYLSRLRKGDVVVICRRNVPVAEIRPLPAPRARKRPVGLAKGRLSVPDSFFEPLPPELLRGFEGNET